jgi:hypothetical protein
VLVRVAAFGSTGTGDAFGGVDFNSCTARRAFSTMTFCFTSSFARMGTKSCGTGVLSLKFCENFLRSLSFTALDSRCKDLWRSDMRSFSAAENCLKESKRSCSTFAVALSGLPGFLAGIPPIVGLKVVLGFGVCSAAGLASGAAVGAAAAAAALAGTSLGVSTLVGGATCATLVGSGVTSFSDGLVPRCATLAAESGRASCEEMIAGSTGAPGTVG